MRLLLTLAVALAWPGCDSNLPPVDDDQPETYRVLYRVEGDVVRADSVKYQLGTGEVMHAESVDIPFAETSTLQPGTVANLWVNATPFNPWQPIPNKEVTVIGSILVNNEVVASDTVRGSRSEKLAISLTATMPQ
ncbi:MAG: hypothetical protein JJ896_12790 [Rhodothermales bacterium]|nr:hypothetical protein [Rhodothermales bacterium]MBO6780524.1 hypothetical protein [Rhodothermales bacterium]